MNWSVPLMLLKEWVKGDFEELNLRGKVIFLIKKLETYRYDHSEWIWILPTINVKRKLDKYVFLLLFNKLSNINNEC